MDAVLQQLNRTVDAWLRVRVAAHRARADAALAVPLYLRALRVVRDVESVLEPRRAALGATSSRAFELVTTNEQLSLEEAA
jgi:hypothetical protein